MLIVRIIARGLIDLMKETQRSLQAFIAHPLSAGHSVHLSEQRPALVSRSRLTRKCVRKCPSFGAKTPRKTRPAKMLAFLASDAILQAQQVERPFVRLKGSELFSQLNGHLN